MGKKNKRGDVLLSGFYIPVWSPPTVFTFPDDRRDSVTDEFASAGPRYKMGGDQVNGSQRTSPTALSSNHRGVLNTNPALSRRFANGELPCHGVISAFSFFRDMWKTPTFLNWELKHWLDLNSTFNKDLGKAESHTVWCIWLNHVICLFFLQSILLFLLILISVYYIQPSNNLLWDT